MIEVLMLLAVFATNILKPISKVLEDYDSLMSLAELIVEGLFLLLVLKEFAMTRQDFEWTRKDRREEKTKRELCYFGWFVRHYYTSIYEEILSQCLSSQGTQAAELKNKLDLILKGDEKIIHKILETVPLSILPRLFCQKMIGDRMKALHNFNPQIYSEYDYKEVYKWFIQEENNILKGDLLPPSFIYQSYKYFKSDDEIDEIYEKLTKIGIISIKL